MKKNISNVLVLILSSLFFFGCRDVVLDSFQNDQETAVKISGTLGITGAVPSELISGPSAGRTAFPSMPITSYEVWIVDAATNQKVKNAVVDQDNMTYEISVDLEKSYYLCASAIYEEKPVLSYRSEKITVNSDNPLITQNIVLKPVVSADGKGKVSLAITAGDGSPFDQFIAIWNGNSQQRVSFTPYIFTMNDAEVPSGSYDVTFRFFKNGNIVYEFIDLVHVFDNATTDVWVKNGNEPYLEVDASGRAGCKITKACTDSFIQHVFYVDASRQNTNPSGANYTTETGGFYNPYCTFIDALSKASAVNGVNDNVRIFIKTKESTSAIHSETIYETINPYINLEVETYVNVPGDKLGKAEFVSDISDSLLKVENNQIYSFTNIIFNGYENCTSGDGLVNIGNESYGPGNASFTNCEFINAKTAGASVIKGSAEFEDCKFLDNQNTGKSGGGLFIKSGTSVTLSGTTQINGNAAESGGGIYTAGTLTIKGNCLIGDSTVRTLPTEQNYANLAGYGAGIYAVKAFSVDSEANLTLAGNFALSMGGGIYFNIGGETQDLSSTTIKYCATGREDDCVGGGIYVDEGNRVNITSSAIECCDSRSGGGIYAGGVPVILAQDTVIKDNTADYGSGIFVDPDGASNYLGMQDNAYVASNNDVYLGSDTTIKLLTAFSLPDDANGVAAVVALGSYTTDYQVLTQETGQQYVENNYMYFRTASAPAYIIGSDGRLKEGPGSIYSTNVVINGIEIPKTSMARVISPGTTAQIEMTDDSSWNSYYTGNDDMRQGVFVSGRKVQLSPFVMSQYAVTQKLFQTVSGETNPRSNGRAAKSGEVAENRPVVRVSWYEAVAFCNALTSQVLGAEHCVYYKNAELTEIYTFDDAHNHETLNESSDPLVYIAYDTTNHKFTKDGYRLPTETEWEFAARGGDPSEPDWKYAFSGVQAAPGFSNSTQTDSGADDYMWYSNNARYNDGSYSDQKSHEVGLKLPNRLNLYDMCGNCREWCWDFLAVKPNAQTPVIGALHDYLYTNEAGYAENPLGPDLLPWYSERIHRRAYKGSAPSSYAYTCTVSFRPDPVSNGFVKANQKDVYVGFRICRSIIE